MEELEGFIRKLMKKVSNPVRTCIHNVWIKHRPKTINQLVKLVERCIKDRSGMSESDWIKYSGELKDFQRKLEKENEELKDLLEEIQEQPKKIQPRNIPPKLQ